MTGIELNIKNSLETYADFRIYKMRLEQCEMRRYFFVWKICIVVCGMAVAYLELSVVVMKGN
jgi:hypothetical protein